LRCELRRVSREDLGDLGRVISRKVWENLLVGEGGVIPIPAKRGRDYLAFALYLCEARIEENRIEENLERGFLIIGLGNIPTSRSDSLRRRSG
jgi:hypothetical protein